jgi:hypothetical protein
MLISCSVLSRSLHVPVQPAAPPAAGRVGGGHSGGDSEAREDPALEGEPGDEDADECEDLHGVVRLLWGWLTGQPVQIICSTFQTIIFIRFMHASQ